METEEFVAAMQKAYNVELPVRYRKFLDGKEYAALGQLKLLDGYVRGTFDVEFIDAQLTDLAALGEDHGIDDMDDIDWPDEFADFVPFATLSDAFAGEEAEPMKSFLIMSVRDDSCPIAVWDYDGWSIYPLAQSIDDFIAGVAKAKRLGHNRAATPYKKFSWQPATRDDD
jgi:hypothetical protein